MISPAKIWRAQKNIGQLIGKIGEIVSWTVIRVPPAGFEDQAPYPVALVKLESGITLAAQIVDYSPSDLEFGRKVVLAVRRTILPGREDIIAYGIKARPI